MPPTPEPSGEEPGEPGDGAEPDEPGTPGDPGAEPGVPVEPVPTVPLVDMLAGTVHWSAAQSPVVLTRNTQVGPGSSLIIEPGVEVRLGWGTALTIDGGELHALGTPDQPVRFVSADGRRWQGIYGRAGSTIVLDNTRVEGGGASGTVLTSEQGELLIRGTTFTDNGGTILTNDSRVEIRDSHIYGNDLPYGGALNLTFNRGNFLTLTNNRIGGNRLSEGAPGVSIRHTSALDTLIMDVQGNLILSEGNEDTLGTNLHISTSGNLQGTIACNTMLGSMLGMGLRTDTLQVPGLELQVHDNIFDQHIPPVIPEYIRYGIGRGATSEVALDMRNNWWGNRSGPYHPAENADGRGNSVGNNIDYRPWLRDPPACAPLP